MKALISLVATFVLLLALMTSSFAQVSFTPTEYTTHPQGEKLINIFQEALSSLQSGEFETFRSYVHPEFAIYGTGGPDSLDADLYIEQWKGYLATGENPMSDGSAMAIRITDGPEKGDWVMAYMLSQWTHKESGNTISAWMHSTVRIENGKIRRIYHFQDNMAILGQMGFKVVPGNSDE